MLVVVSYPLVAEVGDRGGTTASWHVLPHGGNYEEGRGCRKLAWAARKWQRCKEVYGVKQSVLDCHKWAWVGGERSCRGLTKLACYCAVESHGACPAFRFSEITGM